MKHSKVEKATVGVLIVPATSYPTTQYTMHFSLFPLFGSDEWIEETPQLVHVREDLWTMMILHEQYDQGHKKVWVTYQDQGAFASVQ